MGKKAKYSFSDILFSTALIHNPVLIQAVGLGAVVAVCTTVKTALLLSLVFAPVMIVTQVIASAVLKKVPRWIRVTLYLIIGTAMIVPVIYLIDIYAPDIRLGAGIYLALTAINSVTAIHCEKIAVKTDVKSAFYDAAASSIGYAVVIMLVGLIRELLGASSIWGMHVNLPVHFEGLLLPFGGFLMLGFLAAILKAFINQKYPDLSDETELKIKKTSVIVKQKKLNEVENKPEEPKAEEKKAEKTAEKPEEKTEEKTEEASADEKPEESVKEEKIDIPETPEYDTTSLLTPLDDTGDTADHGLFGSFEELKFDKRKSINDDIDSALDDIIGSFERKEKKSKEEKK